MSARAPRPLALVLALGVLGARAGAQDPPSEETIAFFAQNCASCHTIGGGRLTGPDLKGATERREKAWLVEFLQDPKAMIDSGDPYAQALLADARGVYMPPVPGMTRELAGKLVDLIEAESALEKSRFIGLQISDRPLTDADTARGRALFEGREGLLAGGPACIGCHAVAGVGPLGGGRLGPDLTAVYARLEGRKALAAWLAAPPSPVMQPVFRERPLDAEEVLALVAFLRSSAETGVAEAQPSTLPFVLLGLGLAAALLVAFDLLWKGRFRAVRRPLVATR